MVPEFCKWLKDDCKPTESAESCTNNLIYKLKFKTNCTKWPVTPDLLKYGPYCMNNLLWKPSESTLFSREPCRYLSGEWDTISLDNIKNVKKYFLRIIWDRSIDLEKVDSIVTWSFWHFPWQQVWFHKPQPIILKNDLKCSTGWLKPLLLCKYRAEPYMLAIIVMTGTTYACNVSYDWDHICLQS